MFGAHDLPRLTYFLNLKVEEWLRKVLNWFLRTHVSFIFLYFRLLDLVGCRSPRIQLPFIECGWKMTCWYTEVSYKLRHGGNYRQFGPVISPCHDNYMVGFISIFALKIALTCFNAILVGGLEHQFYFPIYWECHHPNWLSYFSEGFKPPTSICCYYH